MEVCFKIATREDVKDIIDLCNECFNETTNVEDALKVFDATADDKNQIYLVGRKNDRIVAHAKITIVPTMYKDMNTYAILNHVCVRDEYRRHHIATKMLKQITEIVKEHNGTTIKLWSNNFRNAAHACYKKYGFTLNDAGFFSKEIDTGGNL